MDKGLLRGGIFGILAALASGTVPVLTSLLLSRNTDFVSIMFITTLLIILLVIRYIKATGRPMYLGLNNTLRISLLSIPLACSSLLWAYSLILVNAGVSTAIMFAFPLMIPLITTGVMHDRLNNGSFLGILCGIIGIFFVGNHIIHGAGNSLFGIISVLVAAFLYAIYIVGVNRQSIYPLPVPTITLWSLITFEVIYLIIFIIRGSFSIPTDLLSWVYIILIACIPTLIVYPFYGYCTRYSGYTFTVVTNFLTPIATIFFCIILGQPITMNLLIGALIIAVAGAVVTGSRNLSRHIIRPTVLTPAKRHKR